MKDISNTNWNQLSDLAILDRIGEFVKHYRLEQDMTQQQLADRAGINRTTLSELENGKRSTMLTLIQTLRALGLLNVLEAFRVERQISPLALAEMERKSRQRASGNRAADSGTGTDWQ